MRRRSRYKGQSSLPMAVPQEFQGFVALDLATQPGEDIKLTAKALHIPSLTLVDVSAVLERTVIFADAGPEGTVNQLARRSQIAVRPENVVRVRRHGATPWRDLRDGPSQSA